MKRKREVLELSSAHDLTLTGVGLEKVTEISDLSARRR
jgi:hypothetical protein